MLRFITPLLLVAVLLTGCDQLIESALKAGESESGGTASAASESLDTQLQLQTDSKPEIILAFAEISRSAYAHNSVLVERMERNQPANGPAYSAGILVLDKAAREHGGLTKQIIDAVAAAYVYEKGIFVVFDTMDLQAAGMKTRGGSIANQRRGYIQILDSGIHAYDRAIRHLETWEEPLLQKQFDKKKVPQEIATEFFRLKRASGAKISPIEKEMFREGRAALQSYRTAFIQTDQAQWNKYAAEARRHEQKASQLRSQMIAEIRKQLQGSTLL